MQGIPRTARFNPQTEAANGLIIVDEGEVIDFALIGETATLRLGGGILPQIPKKLRLGTLTLPKSFARMEGTPHGAAHMSFNGRINNVPVAPEDPLFFLLHCNVDRLWALWQSMFERDDQNDTDLSLPQAGDEIRGEYQRQAVALERRGIPTGQPAASGDSKRELSKDGSRRQFSK